MAQQTLETFNQIDILVNNAGIAGKTATLPDLDESDWDAVLNVNLKGVFLCCKAVDRPHDREAVWQDCQCRLNCGQGGQSNTHPVFCF